MHKPSAPISVVIATYNSQETIEECLASIRAQRYPQKNIEILLADGGSWDNTFAIAQKYQARIVNVHSSKQGAEYNRATGAYAAKHKFLLFLDHDNVLPNKNIFAKMVQPLLDDPKIVGVETLRYTYRPNDSIMGRYFALFGVNDIFAFYVGKADRLAYFYDNPSSYGVFRHAKVRDVGSYFSVDFHPKYIPTLGSNGFLVRKNVLFDHGKVDKEHFFHIDVNVDVIRKGFNRYAFIKDSIHHKTDERGLWDYLRRRRLFVEKYHFGNVRRYSLFEPTDLWATLLFVFWSITLIKPTIDAMRGYLRVRDIAWFLNPIMCISIAILYGFAIMRRNILRYANSFVGK